MSPCLQLPCFSKYSVSIKNCFIAPHNMDPYSLTNIISVKSELYNDHIRVACSDMDNYVRMTYKRQNDAQRLESKCTTITRVTSDDQHYHVNHILKGQLMRIVICWDTKSAQRFYTSTHANYKVSRSTFTYT